MEKKQLPRFVRALVFCSVILVSLALVLVLMLWLIMAVLSHYQQAGH
jgi:hypothetical protein